MKTEKCSYKDIIDRVGYAKKAAALRVSPSIVSVIAYDVPEASMTSGYDGWQGTLMCPGSGITIQSDDTVEENASYSGVVLCPADLFKRTNSIQPDQIKVDVRGSGSKLYKAELIACDFHFNIATLRIKSDSPLCPATLCNMSDLPSLDGKETNQTIQCHSNLPSFKVHPGTKILIAKRRCSDPFGILLYTGELCTYRSFHRAKEPFSIMHPQPKKCKGGGAIINYHGEVVGLFFRNGSVLPLNLVLRWWDHYNSFREFRRPYLGVRVANLHESLPDRLKQSLGKFPNIASGVVVTEVEKNSPAHLANIKRGDAIIKCDGYLIRSKLKLFEIVWDNCSRVVKLHILKASSGRILKQSMAIGETASHKLYEWGLPDLCCAPESLKPGASGVP